MMSGISQSLRRAVSTLAKQTTGDGLTVKVTEALWKSLRSYLLQDRTERVAYAMGHVEGSTLVLTNVVLPPDDAYLSRTPGNVSLSGDFVTQEVYHLFGRGTCNAIVNLHSHPFGQGGVWYSDVDDRDDRHRLAHEEDKLPKAKQIYGQHGVAVRSFSFVVDQASFDGRYLDRDTGAFVSIERLVVVGQSLQVLYPSSSPRYRASSLAPDSPSRQEQCFGGPARVAAAQVRAVIAGTGGVGSVMAEMLPRQGVTDICVIDMDRLEASNLPRFQAGGVKDVGRLKVDVLSEHLTRCFPDLRVTTVSDSIYSQAATDALLRSDVAFGGIDNTAGRAFLSRLSMRYLLPLFDCGAQILGDANGEARPIWRMGLTIPGLTACGDCSRLHLYDRRQADEEFLDPLTTRLAKEKGYLSQAPNEPGAAVYALNMALVASVGLSFQNLLLPHRKGAHYLSNVIEFDARYQVVHDAMKGHEACWVAQVRVPLDHANAQASDDCPHCQPHLLGSLNAFSVLYPACSGRAKELIFPDPAKYLASA